MPRVKPNPTIHIECGSRETHPFIISILCNTVFTFKVHINIKLN